MRLISTKYNISIILILLSPFSYCSAQTGIWEELKPANSPPPRASFGMAEIGNNKVLIFGGIYNSKIYDDTWIYDYSTNNWTEIINDMYPPKRFDLKMSRINHSKVLLFGGSDPINLIDGGYKDDTWIFDLETLSWTEIKPQLKPSPRRNFCLTQLYENIVLLFGGDTIQAHYANDTWIFNLNKNNWEELYIDYFTRPPQYEGAILAMLDTGKLLFYGGWQFKLLDQTWIFNFNENKWNKIIPKSKSIPIASSSMTNIGKNEVVFWGGDSKDSNGTGNYNKMWVFCLNDSSWRNVQTLDNPDGRFFHNIINLGNNKILLFGGSNNRSNIWHNDTWIFTLQPNDIKENNYTSNNNIKSYLITDKENKLKIKSSNDGKLDYQLYDIFGNKLLEKEDLFINSDDEIINVDVSEFTNGLYFFITHQNNNIEVSKVLISR